MVAFLCFHCADQIQHTRTRVQHMLVFLQICGHPDTQRSDDDVARRIRQYEEHGACRVVRFQGDVPYLQGV